jgi:3-methyladenine DNA glycosylase AlkD
MQSSVSPPSLADIRNALQAEADPRRAAISQRFFKTGPGEYAEGDVFLGVRVPLLRKLAKAYLQTSLSMLQYLLSSPVHEERHLALFILVQRFAREKNRKRREIYDFYLENLAGVNNWDLVDASAEHIVGAYLFDRSPRQLLRLARSCRLWDRRVAIMATFHFIKRNHFNTTFELADLLLRDPEDLIQKAVGWMLREIGKRDPAREETFLKPRYLRMPRTMLRYAIEKFPEPKRCAYLQGKIRA